MKTGVLGTFDEARKAVNWSPRACLPLGKAGAKVLTQLFFPGVPGVRVDRVWREEQVCHITATTTRCAAQCPLCHRRSKRVHSHYERRIADLPCGGSRVLIH